MIHSRKFDWFALTDIERPLLKELHAVHAARLREHDDEHEGVACYCESETCRAAYAFLVRDIAA
jgi:hypothetical protein